MISPEQIKLLENQEVNIWNNENWSKVIVKKTGINKNLIRVNLSNGSYLDCTPEHKFYIIKAITGWTQLVKINQRQLESIVKSQ